MSAIVRFIKYITFYEILKGLALTFRVMLEKPVTRQYPDEKPVVPPVYRGLHALRKHPNGKEVCIACGLCAAYCPTRCITIRTSEAEDHTKVIDTYEIDILKCLFCGYCVEACPVRALAMTQEYELSTYDKKSLIYTKDMLLANGDKYAGKEMHFD